MGSIRTRSQEKRIPRSVRTPVIDVDQKVIGPMYVEPLNIFVNCTESQKGKGKEVNLTKHFEGISYLDASDFVNDFDETAHADN